MTGSKPSGCSLRSALRVALLVGVVALVACGGGESASPIVLDDGPQATAADGVSTTVERSTPAASPTSPTPAASDDAGTAPAASSGADPDRVDLGRVVALAEEFLLSDVLSLGIDVVASTATVDAVGFQGIEDHDTSDIEVLPQTTLSLEYLASLRPDTIVTVRFWIDQVGRGVLEAMADVIVVPDGLQPADQITVLGELTGRRDRAAAVVADLESARAAAAGAVGHTCAISLATVYPGPTVAVFVDGSWSIPAAFESVGCELLAGSGAAEPDANGRVFLSDEQIGLLDQTPLVLMQNDSVDGEAAALDEMSRNPIWRRLPAIESGNVVVLDRLGYPGAAGQIRLFSELPEILGA